MGTGYCDAHGVPGAPKYALPLVAVSDPAATILYAERWDSGPSRCQRESIAHTAWDDPACATADHGQGGYYVFADGHTERLRFPDTLTYQPWPSSPARSAWH